MKIAFPIGSFYPSQTGGPCNLVYALAQSLRAYNIKPYVVTTDIGISHHAGVKTNRWVELDGLQVYYKRISNASSYQRRPWLWSFQTSSLTSLYEEIQPDILHLTSIFTILSHQAAVHGKRAGIPYVWSPQGELMQKPLQIKPIRKKWFFRVPLVRKLIASAKFHVTSLDEDEMLRRFLRDKWARIPEDSIYCIPPLVDRDIFAAQPLPQTDISFPYILFLGRIAHIKNIELLLQGYAASSIRGRIKLLIAGWTGEDPAYTHALRQLVLQLDLQRDVTWTEQRIEGQQKLRYFRNAALSVLPSHSESFGLTVVESLAQGTPVLTTRNTPWKMLEQRRAGFWVESTPDAMTRAIDTYFQMPSSQQAQMRANALDLAQDYRTTKLIKQYISMYEGLRQSRTINPRRAGASDGNPTPTS